MAMNLWNILLYLIINAFHIYVFFRAYRIFFGRSRVGRFFEVLGFFVFYTVNSGAFLLAENPFLNLTTSVIPLLLLTFLYPGKIRTKLGLSIFICLASMLLESISLSILQVSHAVIPIHEPTVVNIMADMLLFLAELFYTKSNRENNQKALRLQYWLAMITLPVGSIVITVLVYGGDGYRPASNLVIITILIIINVLSFHLYEVLNRYYLSDYEHRLLLQQNAAYEQEFAIIRKANESVKLMRHDMKNHISAIRYLIQARKYEELDTYLAGFENYEVQGAYVSTGNSAVDSILNYKLGEAEALGASLKVDVAIPEQMPIKSFDISIILGNLLDNANEALRKSTEKILEVQLFADRGALYIYSGNTYNGEVKKLLRSGREVYATGKEQPELHGIGLVSISRAIENYHGTMRIDDSGQWFHVNIMLYLS